MKCIDCGYNISIAEAIAYHDGHWVTEGWFEEPNPNPVSENKDENRRL